MALGRRTAWDFPVLEIRVRPKNSVKGCIVEGCYRFAHYDVVLGKRGGLFRFTAAVCASCLDAAGVRRRPGEAGMPG